MRNAYGIITRMKTVLYVVLPCYNEEQCLDTTASRLIEKMSDLIKKGKLSNKSKIVFVDDGSKDQTWAIISRLQLDSSYIIGLKLAHNVGHQNALLAGLLFAKDYSDAVVSMDADLQDPLETIDKFIEEFKKGNEIVYGVRSDRKKDSFFKRTTAHSFYKFMRSLGIELVYNSADCRLMSRRALEQLSNYSEVNLFLRGIVPLIGLKSSNVLYKRSERLAGESKYPIKKMLNFAWDGITSFSIKPIRIISIAGLTILFLGIVATIATVIAIMRGINVNGWIIAFCLIGIAVGIQMLSLGIIGEYVGKIYSEVKRRPRYLIETIVGKN